MEINNFNIALDDKARNLPSFHNMVLSDRALLFRSLMEEEWRDIKGYEGHYQVSNLGNIRSLDREVKHDMSYFSKKKGRVLGFGIDRGGYRRVLLHKNNIGHTITVHRLVWEHFGDKPRNGRVLQIDHIDGNKRNNRIDNLQLLSARENMTKYYVGNKANGLPTGVFQHYGKYQAHIHISGHIKHLGTFDTPELASQAYQQAKARL